MSHFSVIVVGDEIDEQLAPYAEQDADEKYLEFNDTEQEYLEEYQNKTTTIITLVDGTVHNKYEEQFRVYDHKEHNSKYIYPEDAKIHEGKFSELYPTFEEFVSGWHGTEERDEKKQRYGYWSNPQAQWDWYSVGGRWTGYFKPKSGARGFVGKPGAFDNQPKNGWVDSIALGDIDVEGMESDSINEANKTYDALEAVLKGRALPSWNTIREKHGEDIEAARTEYGNLEVVNDLNKANFWSMDDLVETFGHSRAEYVEKCKKQTMVPYAIVKDGKWYQKGEMGWWGMSSNEMSQDEWNTKFWEMIRSLDPTTKLTLIDCHI